MFLELLSLMAGTTVFVAALMEGRKAGILGIAVGFISGLAIGFGVFWVTRVILKWADRRLNLHEPKLPPVRLALSWIICLLVLIGAVVSGIITSYLTRHVIRLVQ